MDRYLIETPHTVPECLDLVKLLNAQGYLWNFDWGCEAGIHSGWVIIEAENEAQARLAVPPLVRSRARIIKLNKFDAVTIEDYEKQQAAAPVSGGRYEPSLGCTVWELPVKNKAVATTLLPRGNAGTSGRET